MMMIDDDDDNDDDDNDDDDYRDFPTLPSRVGRLLIMKEEADSDNFHQLPKKIDARRSILTRVLSLGSMIVPSKIIERTGDPH